MQTEIGIPKTSILYSISEKVKKKGRITEDEALVLFEQGDLLELGVLANMVRESLHQNKAYYILNGHINYSNICTIRCSFCAFRKKRGEDKAYEMSLEAIRKKFLEFNQGEIREVHIVGGLNPDLPFSYYQDMLRTIREIHPEVCIKAFTAAEIDHFSRLFGLSWKEILEQLMENGLGMLPGGAAEIFSEEIRKKICPTKIIAKEWLDIHRTAHELGLKSNATMLFGHIESYEDRIDHLSRLRRLQDDTDGFLCLIPLTYHPDYNPLRSDRTSTLDELKTIAISRIFLDNFSHIKAYWIMLGVKTAQMALHFGADDLDGTVREEKITHSAGAKSPQNLFKEDLQNLIRETGKIPIERDALYNEL